MKFNKNKQAMVSRKKTRKPLSERLSALSGNFRRALPLALMAGVVVFAASLVYGGYSMVGLLLEVPVEQVQVSGHLDYQSKSEIKTVINRYVENGFIQVDLQKLREELVRLPWIQSATVKRQLPGGLLIDITEQEPLAHWNDNAFINQYGELLQPDNRPHINGLPVFSGLDHKRVLDIYARLNAVLPERQKPIRQLHVDSRETVRVMLASNALLIMSLEHLDEQVGRWWQISNAGLGEKLYAVRQVDLRYSNGAAVSWNEEYALADKKTVGGHH